MCETGEPEYSLQMQRAIHAVDDLVVVQGDDDGVDRGVKPGAVGWRRH